MNIKQIGSYEGDIIDTIMENRKVSNVELFLNPTDEDNLDGFDLANMREGTEVVLAHILVNSHIGLLVDPDADGFTSASIMYQYIKKINPEVQISYFLHDSKSHGLTEKILEQVSLTNIELLIIPDAGSNDTEEVARLYHMGIDIVVIDHHEMDGEHKAGIIINNQSELNLKTNRNLVGAGMVLKFCQAIDFTMMTNHAEGFYDLVALGQIGDGSDISQNEVRNMVFKGLNNVTNPFIKLVLEDCFGDISTVAPKDLSFSIIPMINAIVRVGTMEEKRFLFRALNSIDSTETWKVTKKKKNKETGKFDKFEVVQNLYEYTYDICKRVRGRQAALVKKTMAELEKDIDSSGGIAVGIVLTSDIGSITGLVANKISRKLQKPTLLVHLIKDVYAGSGRGFEKVLPNLREWCNDTGLVDYASGHANAFGIGIPVKNFEEFKKRTHNVEPVELIYEVDLLTKGQVDEASIMEINKNKKLFGGKVSEPLFAFTEIKVNKRFIRQKGSMLTFFENGVEFIMYGAPVGLFEELTMNFDPFITMNFVGRPSVNSWGDRTTPQLVLEDCERNENPIELEPESIFEPITAESLVF